MTDVLQQVRDAIEGNKLIAPGDRVVVGVSGGPDSLCLLHVLGRLCEPYNLQLHVAHLNHGTRGGSSDADAEFVEELSQEWGLAVTVETRPVPQLADEHGLAFEETARRVRYAFLTEVAERIGAQRIAVGHNADDQAETVLMHLLRGSGLAGLRGMLPLTRVSAYRLLTPFEGRSTGAVQRGRPRFEERIAAPSFVTQVRIVRPLLRVTRADVENYCADQGLQPRFDRSNLDTTYFRNRLRHKLIPELGTYNPRIQERLCNLAAVVADDYDLLVDVRAQAWADIVTEQREDAVVFDRWAWRQLPVSLQRATIRKATYSLRRSLRDVTFHHVESARKVALDGETGRASTLPMGLELKVGYTTLTIGEAGDPGPPPKEPFLWGDEPLRVAFPGTTPLPETDWVLAGTALDRWSTTDVVSPDHPWTAFFDARVIRQPLVLRRPLPGDTFQPLGMEGHHVKMSELMINLKIPAPWRNHAPLLVAREEILWLCGHRISEKARIDSETRQVAEFRFERTA